MVTFLFDYQVLYEIAERGEGGYCDVKGDQKTEVDAHISKGDDYHFQGMYDEAIAKYTKAIEISPSYALAYYDRGTSYYYKGQYDQVISDFNKAIETNPKYAEAYNNHENVYSSKGQYDQASTKP